MGQTVKRTKSPEQALRTLMSLCARSERASGDALRLMRGWGVEDDEARKILEQLVRERFIDDGRYAAAFVRDKLNLSGWGAGKIRIALRQKGVSSQHIEAAMGQLAESDMASRLKTVLLRKLRSVRGNTPYEVRAKLIRHALMQGYDIESARECARQLVGEEDVWDV